LRVLRAPPKLVAQRAIGEAPPFKGYVQCLASVLRGEMTLWLTTGIDYRVDGMEHKEFDEARDWNVAMAYYPDRHDAPPPGDAAVVYHLPIQNPNHSVLNHDGPGAGTT
jgi:hypothetical protein